MKANRILSVAALLLASFTLHGQEAIDNEINAGEGWFYDTVFGFTFPLDSTWMYSLSFESPVAVFDASTEDGDYYIWESTFGWAYINHATSPWMYVYDTDGISTDLDSVEPGWLYSYGITSNGASPHSFYAATSQQTTNTKLTIEILNGTADSPNGGGVPDDNIYVTLYSTAAGNSFSPSITMGDSMEFKKSGFYDKGVFSFTTTDFSAGRVYVSYDMQDADGKYQKNTGKMPTQQSAISAFDQGLARNDKFELTYNTPASGAANLTAVDYFGIPMTLQTLDAAGNVLQSFTYYSNQEKIVTELEAIGTDIATDAVITDTTTAKHFLRVASPQQDFTGGNPYPDLTPYLQDSNVNGQTVNIVGHYNGATVKQPGGGSVTYPPVDYNYSGAMASTGTITLTGTMTATSGTAYPNGSQNITIQASDLIAGIYSANPPYMKGSSAGAIGDNDAYSAVMRDLLAGFNAGYVGRFNDIPSEDWWSKEPFQEQGGKKYYNEYAQVIQDNSQSYGFAFSDRLRSQLAFFNPEVATLRVTLLSDFILDAPAVRVKEVKEDFITLEWDKVEGATGYRVFHTPPLNGVTKVIDKADATTTVKITDLKPGTPYTFEVWTVANDKGKLYESPKYTLTVSTNGTAPRVSGPGQWQATFQLYTPLIQEGDTFSFNGTTVDLTPGDPNLNVVTFRVSSFQVKEVSGVKQYGSGYTIGDNPDVILTGGGGYNAAALATVAGIPGENNVFGVFFVDVDGSKTGFGYTEPPTVSFSGGGGSGAEWEAVMTSSTGNPKVMQIGCPVPKQDPSTKAWTPVQTEYVLKWLRKDKSVVFEGVLYVTIASESPGFSSNVGLVYLLQDHTQTFLEGNEFYPSIGTPPDYTDKWSMFLTIQPAGVK